MLRKAILSLILLSPFVFDACKKTQSAEPVDGQLIDVNSTELDLLISSNSEIQIYPNERGWYLVDNKSSTLYSIDTNGTLIADYSYPSMLIDRDFGYPFLEYTNGHFLELLIKANEPNAVYLRELDSKFIALDEVFINGYNHSVKAGGIGFVSSDAIAIYAIEEASTPITHTIYYNLSTKAVYRTETDTAVVKVIDSRTYGSDYACILKNELRNGESKNFLTRYFDDKKSSFEIEISQIDRLKHSFKFNRYPHSGLFFISYAFVYKGILSVYTDSEETDLALPDPYTRVNYGSQIPGPGILDFDIHDSDKRNYLSKSNSNSDIRILQKEAKGKEQFSIVLKNTAAYEDVYRLRFSSLNHWFVLCLKQDGNGFRPVILHP